MQPPGAVIWRSGIRPGMDILEIGCGSGAYTTHAAQAAGDGRVYGLDIQPGMLAQVRHKLGRPEHGVLANLHLVRGNATRLPFRDGSLDLVYMVTVLMEIPDRSRTLQEVNRVLKPQGILAVSEFLPDPDYPLRKTCRRIITGEGFEHQETSGSLWTYTMRFQKK